jgi:hypothetical protein
VFAPAPERAYSFLRVDDLHAAIRLGTNLGTAIASTGLAQQQAMQTLEDPSKAGAAGGI